MANRLKSGKKRVRSSEKRRVRNKQTKNAVKKAFKLAEKAIVQKLSEAGDLIKKAISTIDKATERGIIHKNKAARKKSRLSKKAKK
jgi:small subunit ribosomal protein S20